MSFLSSELDILILLLKTKKKDSIEEVVLPSTQGNSNSEQVENPQQSEREDQESYLKPQTVQQPQQLQAEQNQDYLRPQNSLPSQPSVQQQNSNVNTSQVAQSNNQVVTDSDTQSVPVSSNI